jgi:hypothetical protein
MERGVVRARDRDQRELKKVRLGLGHGRVQKDGDKERHWDGASMPLRVRHAWGREGTLGGGL